jgi:large subunit ribosomal protein L18
MQSAKKLFERRRWRSRGRLRRKSRGRVRLSVFRSGKHIYAQVIDDVQGVTLAAASSLDKELKGKLKNGCDKEAAGVVGKLIAERAGAAGLKEVGRLRPRRLQVPRPRQGAGRRRPRGRPVVLGV